MESYNKDTINGIADTVINEIHRSFNDQKKFVLVGHSFGALIALRVASLLEKLGKYGHVISIDGSPTFLKRLAGGLVESKSVDHQLDDDSLMLLFKQFCDIESFDKFNSLLTKCKNRQSKLKLFIECLPNKMRTLYSQQYLENMTAAILNRMKIIINLDNENDELAALMNNKLKSVITLIRPTQASFIDIAEDYGLQNFSEHPVAVKYVEGNHLSVLENPDLANVINNITDSINKIE